MNYFSIGLFLGGLIYLASVVICLGELIFWLSYWVQRKDKPRRYFWQRLAMFFKVQNEDEGEYYMGMAFGGIICGGTMILTWPIAMPIILIVILLFTIRRYLDKKRSYNG